MSLAIHLFTVLAFAAFVDSVRYQPTWESLDSRPLPAWFDDAKLGIFLHWGLYSVPGYTDEWFWERWQGSKPQPDVVKFMQDNYPPGFTYADFGPQFRAEFFDPVQWVQLFNSSGARYVVLTSKHHDGFTLWPSKYSWSWNAGDVGPRRDLVGDLANAIRNHTKIHFGVYHSLFEWFNPLYLQDAANGYKTQDFVARKTMPELYELVNKYQPDIIWSDGEWMAVDTYWNSTNFLAWLYNDSPVKDRVCVNDRWGSNVRCRHGGFLNCGDRFNPDKPQQKKWEDAMTMDRKSWGYRRTMHSTDLYNVDDLIALLVKTVSLGGNLLVNIGPTAYGIIPPAFEDRLRQMGAWLAVNGEAIYSSRPWTHQNDTHTADIWFTSRSSSSGDTVYAISLQWYGGSNLLLGAPKPGHNTTIHLLGYQNPLSYSAPATGGILITVPNLTYRQVSSPGHAWVFKLQGLVK